jgi:hypothetical protein
MEYLHPDNVPMDIIKITTMSPSVLFKVENGLMYQGNY